MKGQKGFVRVTPAPLHIPGAGLAHSLATQVNRWWELARQRRQLASLSDSALQDLGLSRADIASEVERPFWDDPMHK
ncbi:DUF1127 domain-containing protein [Pseudomonas sp. RIT-PI-S]|uniref:DUF1127 domain-containing protein n=1 Tax=Pseudomonas sp. RIT-PI-S TaxID=3035295 RepID=UPI00320A77FB